jgi:hypothetical protein
LVEERKVELARRNQNCRRIHHEVLGSERAAYGERIVVTLSRQLSWSHFSALLPLSQPFQREFYAEMSRIEGWSVRTLRERIDSMLYERTDATECNLVASQ